MINLWSQRKEADSARKNRSKQSPAQLRLQKDLAELELPNTMSTSFPDPSDTMHFILTITPDEGLYVGASFVFDITIGPNYPHDPPKVKCVQRIYHPNLDLDGNVCLNILREDWNPILNLNSVVVGLQFLFLDPNPDDPLNKGACGAPPCAAC
ncbi:NEDD8-conjugating protein ubc12 [Malassezia cuniculi]|uniref:NEDD8-conjugating enzyme UBC12 n=1 Tax=Malassezia cuniculi TaxID=948313 RepID=A0AAF0EU73_9BASI|nr:NEDD8-conjugating protein ubc12 [Malassezia cuniculi]